MSENLIKFGFSAGVLSPRLFGRSDIQKYDLGLALGRNFTINYLGGAFTRPGSEFVDYIQHEDEPARIEKFTFNEAISNTYGILFSKDRIRFIQDGAYVLETAQPLVAVNDALIQITAHGYTTGEWVKIGGRTVEVGTTTADTFIPLDPFGNVVDLTALGATTCARIYTITSPYDTADLNNLTFSQKQDEVYITSLDYPRYKLSRLGATNWTIAEVTDGGFNESVSSLTITASGSGGAGVIYAVTGVDANGNEAPLTADAIEIKTGIVNFTTSSGSALLSWDSVDGAIYYKVYRSLVFLNDANATFSADLGFVGIARGLRFSDENIIPDFTQGPLFKNNPFADGAVTQIDITAGGSGYSRNTTEISVTGGGGSGFVGKPIVTSGGAVIGALILNSGEGYSSPVVTISGGGGSGATATAELSAATGNNPACSALVQQRRVYGGTNNFPGTIFGSRPGSPDNFDFSQFGLASDPYTLSLDASQETPIRFIYPATIGMFLFSASEVTRVSGTNDEVISGLNARSAPQTAEGCAQLEPLRIDEKFIYLNATATAVHSLGPSNLPNYFTTNDVSVFSSHFFQPENPMVNWTWAKSPYNIIWAARNDGTALSCTFLAEQEIAAWSNHTTKGYYEDFTAIRENKVDRVYQIVRRTVDGQTMRYIERQAIWDVATIDAMWAVDAGLATVPTYPTATLTLDGFSGANLTATASAAVFTSGDVGKIIRAGTGRGVVTAFISSTQLTVELGRAIEPTVPELTSPPPYATGAWTLDPLLTTVSGLDHLEGETVELLGDGAVLDNQVVTNGQVILSQDSSYVVAGLGFTGEMKTLPATIPNGVIEANEKRIDGVAVRLYRSRGLEAGDGNDFYSLTKRGAEPYGMAPEFTTGLVEVSIRASFDFDGSVTIRKVGPVQAEVLGLVPSLESSS